MTDIVEDYMKDQAKEDSANDDGLEEKRESLAILASLGETKTYLGEIMSLGDVKKLTTKDVEKYFGRYQAVSSKEVSSTLVDGGIRMFSRVIPYLLPIDNLDNLCEDLENRRVSEM